MDSALDDPPENYDPNLLNLDGCGTCRLRKKVSLVSMLTSSPPLLQLTCLR